MKKQEIFALVAGILGFIVDAIALATFFTHVPLSSSGQRVSSFPRTWGILLLVYGWFLVSWILAQWRLSRRAANLTLSAATYETPASHIVISAVIVVGLLLLPIAFMIVSDFVRDSQGARPLDFEHLLELLVFSLLSMGVIGAGVLGVTYGLLGIINDEEEFNL